MTSSGLGLVATASLGHLRGHVLGVNGLHDGVLDAREHCSESIDAKDDVEMLVVLQLDRVDHFDVALVTLNALYQRLAEHEVVNVSVKDGVRREGSGEPRFSDAWVKDATSVGEAGHVPVEELGRGGDGHGSEDLGLVSCEPVVVVEAKEESKDDVGDVTEPEGGEEGLCDTDGGHELSHTKDKTPPLSGAELTKEREGELSQDGTGVDRRTEGDEAAELVADLGADTWTQGKVHGAGTLRVADESELGITSGGSDVVDDIAEIKGEFLETPSPEARVASSVLGMASFEVGADVGDPHVEALVDKPEGHGALLADDEMRGIAENTVLKDDRVANAAGATRV